jgi:hypothetical protein
MSPGFCGGLAMASGGQLIATVVFVERRHGRATIAETVEALT